MCNFGRLNANFDLFDLFFAGLSAQVPVSGSQVPILGSQVPVLSEKEVKNGEKAKKNPRKCSPSCASAILNYPHIWDDCMHGLFASLATLNANRAA